MLLAIDTSTPQIGLALYNGAQVLAEWLWTSKSRHTVELAPAVVDMLAHTGVKMEEIKALGVATGPGSFTSLRVGLSFVKGLAFARGLAVIGINTLDVTAAGQQPGVLPLACLLPAGRERFALGWYHADQHDRVLPNHNQKRHGRLNPLDKIGWQAAAPASITTLQDLVASISQASLVCGDLNASERQLLIKNSFIQLISPALSVRRPALLAELAYAHWQAGQVDNVFTLAPVYLHIGEAIPESVTIAVEPSQSEPIEKVDSEGAAEACTSSSLESASVLARRFIAEARVRNMVAADLTAATEIDQLSFSHPWPKGAFEVEFENINSRCWVAEVDGRVVAAMVLWRVLDEAHIATIAVHPDFRQQGIGKALLRASMDAAYQEGARIFQLEVRAGNLDAQKMYAGFGFEVVGRRLKYYKDNNEDALLLTLAEKI